MTLGQESLPFTPKFAVGGVILLDTLYSPAVIDLGPQLVVLSVPLTDRYFMLPMMSLWTDVFAVPGTRTTGRNTARNFLVVGPRWQGTAPADLEIIRSPTRFFDIVGRTQVNGTSDYDAVHKVQAGYKLTPLSEWGKGEHVAPKGKVDPSIDMKTPQPVQIDKMDAATYFGRFSELLNDNPPGPFDYPILHRLELLGFKVGQRFDLKWAKDKPFDCFANPRVRYRTDRTSSKMHPQRRQRRPKDHRSRSARLKTQFSFLST